MSKKKEEHHSLTSSCETDSWKSPLDKSSVLAFWTAPNVHESVDTIHRLSNIKAASRTAAWDKGHGRTKQFFYAKLLR
jgi:hypothetical protein